MLNVTKLMALFSVLTMFSVTMVLNMWGRGKKGLGVSNSVSHKWLEWWPAV
jgi:hypothetical protein